MARRKPSRFVRELIRRYMEKTVTKDHYTINALLRQSLAENSYSDLTDKDADSIRESIV